MDIFGQFKKQYAHYFVGVIIPAAINGVSIPLLKYALGTAAYGQYALYFNLMLIANLFVCGWLWQGVLRFTARIANKIVFASQLFYISLIAPVSFFLPVLLLIWYWNRSWGFAFLFAATLLMAALQLPRQALMQASFQSKTVVKAEAVRTVSWLVLVVAIVLFHIATPTLFFVALFLSYGASVGYLYIKKAVSGGAARLAFPAGISKTAIPLLQYGFPFSLWYVLFYLVSYIDKVYMLGRFGAVVQGNYNALFDFTAKALVLLLSPVLLTATPLLSDAYEKGAYAVASRLLRRLILYEVVAMLVALVLFGLIGGKLIFLLLHIPDTVTYKQMGLLIIAGTFMWQIALLVQKRFELLLQSSLLLVAVTFSLCCQWLFYYLIPLQLATFIPLGYCLSGGIYLLVLGVAGKFKWDKRQASSDVPQT